MKKISLEVNGKNVEKEVPDHTTLSDLLRDILNLTGTHVGCDTSQCGACNVLFEGKVIKSCSIFVVEADGHNIVTIEGIENEDGSLSTIQEAFQENHGLQCGYCTPGVIITAIDLLKNNKRPSEVEIREYLEGNICRCTGYQNIVKSIQAAAEMMEIK